MSSQHKQQSRRAATDRQERRTHLRPREIAKVTGVGIHTVYRLIYAGQLRSIKISVGNNRKVLHLVPLEDFENLFQTKYKEDV